MTNSIFLVHINFKCHIFFSMFLMKGVLLWVAVYSIVGPTAAPGGQLFRYGKNCKNFFQSNNFQLNFFIFISVW
jgi:H+/Cl- antiporter ClcA